MIKTKETSNSDNDSNEDSDEDLLTEEINIEKSDAGLIIGWGGRTCRRLQSKTNTWISVIDDETDDGKSVIIRAEIQENIDDTKKKIRELINAFAVLKRKDNAIISSNPKKSSGLKGSRFKIKQAINVIKHKYYGSNINYDLKEIMKIRNYIYAMHVVSIMLIIKINKLICVITKIVSQCVCNYHLLKVP